VSAVRLCVRGEGQTLMSSYTTCTGFLSIIFNTESDTCSCIYNSDYTYESYQYDKKYGKDVPNHIFWFVCCHLFVVHYYPMGVDAEFGHYVRYTFVMTTLLIVFDERSFYIKNIEEPIVRKRQVIFQALLFTSLAIELFGFSFLLVRLFIIPNIRRILSVFQKYRNPAENHRSNMSVQCMPSP